MRNIWVTAAVMSAWLLCGLVDGVESLPMGGAPPALHVEHMPDRAHAFVWRNWNLVETPRLARVLETSDENIRRMAASMGLPAERAIPREYGSRLYLSIIRRNWHLLPYEQLLTLLDMDAEKLNHILREDDFLFIKLGSLKPRCEKLVYLRPTPEVSARVAQVRKWVEEEFDGNWPREREERFAFLKRFQRVIEKPRPVKAGLPLRYVYSYFAIYGDPLMETEVEAYPDGLLQDLADLGINGVWLHVVLRDLAPSAQFAEFGKDHEKRLESLRKLVVRAKRFGIGIYLYMNEPRAMPAAFFEKHSEIRGVKAGDYVTMCTSTPAVRRWVTDSLEHVFKSVPDLGGVFTITASENLTNCASHFGHKGCVRCSKRDGAEIIAEINAAIEQGVRKGNANAKVLAWDWGWPDSWAPRIIAKLPKSCWLMSVSEWSIPIERGGVKVNVGEYSISVVGPGPRAKRHWKLAKEAGLKTAAKMQVNNTWELSAVPYLPVMQLVEKHIGGLKQENVDGMMLSWTLGGYPSPNLGIATGVGGRQEEGLRRAGAHFSEAFLNFPYEGSVVYNAPLQLGPANLLYARKTGYSATMVGLPYDDLKSWRGPYPPEVFVAQLEKVADGWEKGLAELSKSSTEEGREVMRVARAAGLHFRSVANQSRFVMSREALNKPGVKEEDRNHHTAEIRRLLVAEADNARELLGITLVDSRLGFEASNQYYYLPQDLVEKIVNCRHLLDVYGGEDR